MTTTTTEPIRIGTLFSDTGVTSVIEKSERMGTTLAAAEINEAGGINGRPLQLVSYDPESRPARYQQLAERLILEDGVRIILGCYMSSTRKALIPVVEKWNALLMYPTLYEGFEYSRNVIYTGAAPNQNSASLAEFMLRMFGSRVFMVGSDYIYAHESNRIMSDLILEKGGDKVAEHYLPLDASWDDYLAVAKKIKLEGPDFIFSTVVGDGTALLYRAYAELGLDPTRTPIASLTTCEAEVQQMSPDVAEGHITSAVYFQSIANEVNQRCVAACKRHFGDDIVTNMCWEAAYFQTHLLANALRKAESDSVRELLRVLPGTEFLAPQGLVRLDEDNHHTYLRPRIGRVNARGQFDILQEATHWVRPDPLSARTYAEGLVRTRAPACSIEQRRMLTKSSSGTSRQLRELRSLRVLLMHPDDQDGQELRAQLQRIGCQVKASWPPPVAIQEEADLVFFAIRPEVLRMDLPWLKRSSTPPIIAVVTYEDPTTIEAVLRLNVCGVLAAPVKSFGLLTSIVLARHIVEGKCEQDKYVARLQQRLAAQRKLNRAKAILMHTRGISEEEAYKDIRDQAMARRVTTEEIADAVINANEVLGNRKAKAG